MEGKNYSTVTPRSYCGDVKAYQEFVDNHTVHQVNLRFIRVEAYVRLRFISVRFAVSLGMITVPGNIVTRQSLG